MQIACEEWEILSTHEIIQHMVKEGFTNINEFILFENGKPYRCINNKLYVNFKQENYEGLDLGLEDNIKAAIMLIAEFHKLAKGFKKPAGVRIKTEWGKLIEKYKMMIFRLNKYYSKILQEKEIDNPFIEKTMECRDNILNWSASSNRIFMSELYLNLLETSMRNKEIGIVSFKEDTVIRVGNEIKFSGIFDVSYNMAIEDIGKFIRKCFEKTGDSTKENMIIKEYQKILPLDKNEILMIHAISGFPYECIKIILKYTEDNKKEKQLLEKFVRAYTKELRIKEKLQ